MRLRRVDDEDGVALAATIGILGIVTLLVVAILSASISVTRQTRRDVGWNGALGAAEAGVQDFLFRLNSQPDYWKRFPDPSGVRTLPADSGNAALTGFAPVPRAQDGATFTYSVDQRVLSEGRILLTATGAVGGVTRTIRVTLRRDTFLNYVYAADYGTLDPELYTTWPPNLVDGEGRDRDGYTPLNSSEVPDFAINEAAVQRASQECVHHRYDQTRAASTPLPWGAAPSASRAWDGRHPDCHEFQFNSAIFNGPFQFNDMIAVRGGQSTWTREATTSWGAGTPLQVPAPGYLDVQQTVNGLGAGTQPSFSHYPDSRPRYRTPFEMPPNNRELRDTAALAGYLFTGPTRIVMTHSAEAPGSARIYVDSPASGSRYGLSSGRGYLALPSNGVIYVENAPAAARSAGYRPPLSSDDLTAMYPTDPALADITYYDHTAGDAYVEGELMGRMTIAAQNDIIVTWHIGYASTPNGTGESGYAEPPPVPTTDRDMLGLIADGQIRALKPTRCLYRLPLPNNPPDSPCQHGANIPFRNVSGVRRTIQDLTIYGALLTTQHTFAVDNATMGGSLGRLYLVGTLAEKFASYTGTPVISNSSYGGGHHVPRSGQAGYTCPATVNNGAGNVDTLVVSTSSECRTLGGLVKQFIYDERMRYLEPPSFLAPDAVSWVQSEFEERTAPASLPPLPVASASPSP